MTNVDPSPAVVGDATLAPVLDAAATVERHPGRPAARSTIATPGEPLRVAGLQGNSTTLVEIASSSSAQIAEIRVVSRDRHAQASFTPAAGERLIVPLAAGDYLVMARLAAPAASRSAATLGRRVLVWTGRAYGYDLPTPLPVIPAAHPGLDAAAPFLRRLAYTGSVDGAARLVVNWSSGIGAQCMCIRSPQWGGQWLPYATPSAAAFCLPDGAYEIRAARLADDGTCAGGWSEVIEFVVADGRLAAAPADGAGDLPGDLIDWLGVKPGWRPNATAELQPGGADDGKIAVQLAWQAVGRDADLRYLILYRPDNGGDWATAISAAPEQMLRLEPGRYRIRLCAIDQRVFLRSEFFAECAVTVAASDPPLLAPEVPSLSLEIPVAWAPLPEGGALPEAGADDGLAAFVARPVSSLAGGPEPIAIDLNALAYGQSPEAGRQEQDIAVARALAQGSLPPDQMAAAGDYFLRAGQLETAWHIFEELGRRYRGVDFAQLRCAQLAALCGRGEEARELLTSALASPKNDPARSPSFGSAPKATRDRARVQQQALRAAEARVDLLATRTGTLQEALQDMPALRFKAAQYDRLTRELPALRYKAKRYDELKQQASTSWLQRGVDVIRRWSVRLPGLRHH